MNEKQKIALFYAWYWLWAILGASVIAIELFFILHPEDHGDPWELLYTMAMLGLGIATSTYSLRKLKRGYQDHNDIWKDQDE